MARSGIKNIEENNADPRLHNLNSVNVLQDAIELSKETASEQSRAGH